MWLRFGELRGLNLPKTFEVLLVMIFFMILVCIFSISKLSVWFPSLLTKICVVVLKHEGPWAREKKNPSVYSGWILSPGKPQELCLSLNKFSISLWQDHLVRMSAMQLFISKIRILQMKLVINAECECTIFCWKFLLLGHPSCIFLILLMVSSSYFSLNILTCKILLINIPIPYFFPFHNLCVLPSF